MSKWLKELDFEVHSLALSRPDSRDNNYVWPAAMFERKLLLAGS